MYQFYTQKEFLDNSTPKASNFVSEKLYWNNLIMKKIQKGSVETKSPSMFLGDHHFRNLFFKNLNICKMSLDEFHGQIFSLQHLRQRILEFIYLSKLNIFENLVKNEDFWKFGQNWRFFKFGKNWRFLKIWEKLKIFENLVKIKDFSNFGKNWRFLKIWSKLKIFKI